MHVMCVCMCNDPITDGVYCIFPNCSTEQISAPSRQLEIQWLEPEMRWKIREFDDNLEYSPKNQVTKSGGTLFNGSGTCLPVSSIHGPVGSQN